MMTDDTTVAQAIMAPPEADATRRPVRKHTRTFRRCISSGMVSLYCERIAAVQQWCSSPVKLRGHLCGHAVRKAVIVLG